MNVDVARTDAALYAAVGLRVAALFALTPHLGLRARADLLGALTPISLQLRGGGRELLVWSASPVAVAAGIDLRTIFETELDYVWRSLRRLGVRERDVDDVTHDAFIVVYRTLDQYDPSRPLRPWLFGIASRHAANSCRRP